VSEVIDLAGRWLRGLQALDIESIVQLLADDAVMELPLAPPELPNRFESKREIHEFLVSHQAFSTLEFHDIEMHATVDPDTVVAEFRSTGTFSATGGKYANRYAVVIKAHESRIILYREYFNPLALAGAFAS
jgi:hypothetical protein